MAETLDMTSNSNTIQFRLYSQVKHKMLTWRQDTKNEEVLTYLITVNDV